MKFGEFIKKKIFSDSDGNTDKIFVRNVAISVFALMLCIVIFSATSFAWFNDTTSVGEQTITSSNYSLSISAVDSTDNLDLSVELDEKGNKIFSLVGGQKYMFTITTASDSNGHTGYVKLKVGEHEYCSDQINNGSTFTFSLTFTDDTKVIIIERWGISSIPDEDRELNNGADYSDMTKNN